MKIMKLIDNIFRMCRKGTHFKGRIVWDGYKDNPDDSPVHHVEVVAYGDGWQHATTTDNNGEFLVEVEPNSNFRVKASDGGAWIEYASEIDGIEAGRTKE